MKRIVLLVMAMVGCLGCHAQNSTKSIDCAQTANTQFELDRCSSEQARLIDVELNSVYQHVLSVLSNDPNAVAKVKSAERAWLACRDAYIEAMFPAADKQAEYGSSYPMEVNDLRAKLTRQQIDALSAILKNRIPNGSQ